jgi:hypothetical protein
VALTAALALFISGAFVLGARRASAVTYVGSGFDACSAPSTATMSAWLASPYRSLGIYIGGADRACGDGNLSAAWVNAVEGQGWHLTPLYVGLQAPCVGQGGLSHIDPTQPAAQGGAAADDAAARARFFGLPGGTPIYFDMEGYGNDANCVATVQAFLNSWVAELHAQGFLAGVYGSSSSTIHDQANTPFPNKPDDVWFARWNGVTNLFGDPSFPDSQWTGVQRLHQYQANLTETYGGATINIDRDYDGGDLAGPAVDCGGNLVPGAQPPPDTAPPGWSPWTSMSPPPSGVSGAPAVSFWAPTHFDVFVTGHDGMLWHRFSDDSGVNFYGWENLGAPPGGLTCSPTAVSWAPGRLDVFGRGADAALWHTWWDGRQWRPWESLGGVLISSPSVASWGPGRLDVIAVGADHGIYHKWFQGPWAPWEPMGGFGILDPAAVSWGPNRVDLFTLAPGNQVWHKWWTGTTWTAWFQDVPGRYSSGPAAESWGPGRLDLYLASAGPGASVVHYFLAGAWTGDFSLGGSLTAAPSAVGTGSGRLGLVVLGTDGNLWHRSFG